MPRSRLRVEWAEDFLFAGASALLLLLAGSGSDLHVLSLLALVPFLYRTLGCATATGGGRLGFLLGVAVFVPSLATHVFVAPISAMIALTTGAVLMSGFGWAVGYCRHRFGFHPILVGLLWVAFELILIHVGDSGGFFASIDIGNGLVYKVSALCGFLVFSFAVVVLNSILAWIFDVLLCLSDQEERQRPTPGVLWYNRYRGVIPARRSFVVPAVRGPPVMDTG